MPIVQHRFFRAAVCDFWGCRDWICVFDACGLALWTAALQWQPVFFVYCSSSLESAGSALCDGTGLFCSGM